MVDTIKALKYHIYGSPVGLNICVGAVVLLGLIHRGKGFLRQNGINVGRVPGPEIKGFDPEPSD